MGQGFLRKKVIEPYFLEREAPYTKRRPLKMKSVYWTGGVLICLFFAIVLFSGGTQQRKEIVSPRLDYTAHSNPSGLGVGEGAGSINANPEHSFHSDYSTSQPQRRTSNSMSATLSRTRSANQVIRRGEAGNDPGVRLPMGFGIPVRLVNSVLSTDSATPVIAEVTQDVFPPGSSGNTVSIPIATRVIGNANYDDASHRIQVRFHTLVYPEGDQHGLQGIGLMSDGSAGLSGDYHSGETKRQIGKFIGNFVGGFADGMKERSSSGQFGMPYEPGSLKNGLLNGVSQSASDETKSISDDLGQTKPTMTLNAGQSFVIFLEHEYTP